MHVNADLEKPFLEIVLALGVEMADLGLLMSDSDDPEKCPLCEQPNGCAMAIGKRQCWCFAVRVSEVALARVPEEDRNRRCLCRDCATGLREPSQAEALMAKLRRDR